jgi:hypothetical protein
MQGKTCISHEPVMPRTVSDEKAVAKISLEGSTITCLCFATSSVPNDSFYRLPHTHPIRTPKCKGAKKRKTLNIGERKGKMQGKV